MFYFYFALFVNQKKKKLKNIFELLFFITFLFMIKKMHKLFTKKIRMTNTFNKIEQKLYVFWNVTLSLLLTK